MRLLHGWVDEARTGAVAFALAAAPAAHALTLAGGDLGDQHWTVADSPVVLEGDATIPLGSTLQIDAGVQVLFAATDGQSSGLDTALTELVIEGTLDVNGTTASPVRFAGQTAAAGSWYGLVLASGSSSTVDGLEVTDATHGVHAFDSWTGNGIVVRAPSIDGIRQSGGTATVAEVEIDTSATYGFYSENDGVFAATYCLIHHSGSNGVYSASTQQVTHELNYCTIASSTYSGVGGSGYPVVPLINLRNSVVALNGGYGVGGGSWIDIDIYDSSVWGNNDLATYNDEVYAARLVTPNLLANPLFADPDTGDYELTHRSPARFQSSDGTDLGARPHVSAQTAELMGTQWSDLTLPAGTHSVPGDFTVAPAVTLTLASGAYLELAESDAMYAYVAPAQVEFRIFGEVLTEGPVSMSTPSGVARTWWGTYVGGTATGGLTDLSLAGGTIGIDIRDAPTYDLTRVQVRDGSVGVRVRGGTARLTDVEVGWMDTRGINTSVDGVVEATRCVVHHAGLAVLLTAEAASTAHSFDHCTFADNSEGALGADTYGGGVVDLEVSNSIIAGNPSGTATSYSGPYGDIFVAYSNTLIHESGGTPQPGDTLGGSLLTPNIPADPLFAERANGDYELTHRSPARFQSSTGGDLGAVPHVSAQTSGFMGTLWVDETLAAGTETFVTGDIMVPDGVTLTVEAGATLWMPSVDTTRSWDDPDLVELRVDGALDLLGTSSSPVRLLQGSNMWHGVHLLPGTDAATLTHVEIYDAVNGLWWDTSTAAIVSDLTIGESTWGLYVTRGTAVVDSLTVSEAQFGVLVDEEGAVDLTRCWIRETTLQGVYLLPDVSTANFLDYCTVARTGGMTVDLRGAELAPSTVEVTNSVVRGQVRATYGSMSVSHSIVFTSSGGTPSFGDVTFLTPNERADPLFVSLVGGDHALTHRSPARFHSDVGTDIGALPYAGAQTARNLGTLWEDATWGAGVHTIDGDLTVGHGVTLTLEPGAELQFSDIDWQGSYEHYQSSEFRVEGTLQVGASPANPVRLRAQGTDSGDWYGVHFLAGSSGSVAGLEIVDPRRGLWFDDTGPSVTQTLVREASESGVYVSGGTPQISSFKVLDGVIGVHTASGGAPTLTNCLIADNTSHGLFTNNDISVSYAMHSCTIDNNGLYGIYGLNDGTGTAVVDVTNTSVSNHDVYGVYDNAGTIYDLEAVNLWQNGTDDGTTGSVNEIAVTRVDPLYISVSDRHPSAFSPLVDTGIATGAPAVDLDGSIRPVDGDQDGSAGYDVGAYEYQASLPMIVLTPRVVEVSESGTTATVDVVLRDPPVAGVTLSVVSSDTAEATVSPTTLSFTSSDFDTPQSITITGEDDPYDDGDAQINVSIDPSGSADATYASAAPQTTLVTVVDDDVTELIADAQQGLITTEGGGTDAFTVRLGSRPAAAVQLDITSLDPSEGAVSWALIAIDPSTWDTPRVVTVTGQDDLLADGDMPYNVEIVLSNSDDVRYKALDPVLVSLVNLDDEAGSTPDVLVSGGPLSTTEGGGADTFRVSLTVAPSTDVTVAIASSDTTEAVVDSSALTFTPANYDQPQTVTVTGVDDSTDDGQQPFDILVGPVTGDADYAGLDPNDVSGTNADDDAAGVALSKSSVVTGEDGQSDSFDVVLTSRPASDVIVSISSSNTAEGTVSTSSLTFAPGSWMLPQTVTVTGVDDAVDDGDVAYTISVGPFSGDAGYTGVSAGTVSALNLDDDGVGITVTPLIGLQTTEAGGTDTFTAVLDAAPTDAVTVPVSSADPSEVVTDTSQLVFTASNWDLPQTVTLTGQDDANADGDVVTSILLGAAISADSAYSGLDPADPEVTNIDDEEPPLLLLDPLTGLTTTEAGGSDSFTVTLAEAPTADVVVDLASMNAAEGEIDIASLTFTSSTWGAPQTVTVTGVDDAVDDGDVVYTVAVTDVRSADTTFDDLDATTIFEVEVTNVDDDDPSSAGVYLSATSGLQVTEAGGADTFSVALLSAPSADVTVFMRSSDTSEGTVSPAQLVFGPSTWDTPQTVTVSGVDDSDVDGDIAFTVLTDPTYSSDPTYLNLDPADVEVVNLDDDEPSDTGEDTGTDGGEGCGGCASRGAPVPAWLVLAALLGVRRRRS